MLTRFKREQFAVSDVNEFDQLLIRLGVPVEEAVWVNEVIVDIHKLVTLKDCELKETK